MFIWEYKNWGEGTEKLTEFGFTILRVNQAMREHIKSMKEFRELPKEVKVIKFALMNIIHIKVGVNAIKLNTSCGKAVGKDALEDERRICKNIVFVGHALVVMRDSCANMDTRLTKDEMFIVL